MSKSTATKTTNTAKNTIPPVWRLKNSHELKLMTMEDGSFLVQLEWSEKLTMYFAVPEGYSEEQAVQLIQKMYDVGFVRHDRWDKVYPGNEEIIF